MDPNSPDIEVVIDFLSQLFEKGLGYSCINSARSALSTFININNNPVGQHPLVVRLMKGIFNKRPSLPKNNITWDPEIVLNYLKTLSPAAKLNLINLSIKTVALILILTGQRGQSLHLLDIRNVTVSSGYIKFKFGDILKTSRPGYQQGEITVKAYAPDRRLCLVTVVKEYLEKTKQLRKDTTAMFISTTKPHKKVSRDTISRWFKVAMTKAGLDMSLFTAHSVRSASTSAAGRANVPLQTILKTAGWSRQTTFSKYYEKPLQKTTDFGDAVIQGALGSNMANKDM